MVGREPITIVSYI